MPRTATSARKDTAAPPPFTGFTPALFDLLEGLAANQTRDWFQDHKGAWERDVRAPMAAFVESLTLAFAAHDIPLSGDAERSLFRPNRDVRFSKDKRPYKTNVAAVLSRDGTKAGKGLFYVSLGGHGLDVERVGMFGVGFYAPEPADLAALRTAIARAPDDWRPVEAGLAAGGLTLSRDAALSRLPKGFESCVGSPVAEALRLKSLHAWRAIPEAGLYGPRLIDEAVAVAQAALPLLSFGWRALGGRPD